MPDVNDLNTGFLIGLKPEDVIKHLKQKGYRFSWDWRETLKDAHTKAFTVAKAMKLDILKDIRTSQMEAVEEGWTYDDFVRRLKPILKDHGWWGKVPAKDVPGYDSSSKIDPEKEVQLGSPNRLRIIYRTNLRTSRAAGRWKQQIDQQNDRPYLQYIQTQRPTKRESHAKFHLKVFRIDDPILKKIYPPNDWECECTMISLSQEDVDEKGLKITRGKDVNLKTGFGWDYNPGESFLNWNGDLEETFKDYPHQKTYKDYGRPSVKDVEIRNPAPDKLPSVKEIGEAKMMQLLKKEFDLINKSYSSFKTKDNDTVLFTEKYLKHLLIKKDGRETYAKYIKETLKNPFEVYMTEYRSKSYAEYRKSYIGLFYDRKSKQDMFVVVRENKDGTVFWNAFPRSRGRMDRIRKGELLFYKK